MSDAQEGSKAERREKLKSFLVEFLSFYHIDHPADGCVMPTLSADVARAATATRGDL